MKTQKLLIILISILLTNKVLAQTIDLQGEWRVDYQEVWYPEEFYNNLYRDFIDGDTVINSIQYYKVYRSGYSYYGLFPQGEVYPYNHILHGFLREEDNKWYTFFEDNDTLLFDFTLNVNDTVYSGCTFTMGEQIIVDAVDSVLVNGDYKRRMHLYGDASMVAEYIIEGIGATSGLFENMYMFEWSSTLVCYAKDGVSVWGESTEECDLAVKINENEADHIPYNLYPNPAKDFTLLRVSQGIGKTKLTLIDILGTIVYQDFLESPCTIKIALDGYPSGVYLAILENNGLRKTVKLIIE
jgi:hypothetical protein